MKITKVTKTYFETEGERVYFFEPLDEEMTITELQEMMDENEKFLMDENEKFLMDENEKFLSDVIHKMRHEQITEDSVIYKQGDK